MSKKINSKLGLNVFVNPKISTESCPHLQVLQFIFKKIKISNIEEGKIRV